MNKLLPSILFTSIALVGCNPSDGSKGAVTLDIQAKSSPAAKQLARNTVQATSAPIEIEVIGADGVKKGTVTLDSAWVVVDEIELEHEDDFAEGETEVESEEEIEFVGPFVVDLNTNTTYPELPQVDIKAGNYTDIEFDLEPLTQAAAETLTELDDVVKTKLTGSTVHFEGTYMAEGGSDVVFKFSTDEDIEFEFSRAGETSKGFMVDGAGLNDVIVAFRTDGWFDYSNPETNENPSIDLSVFDNTTEVVIAAGSEVAEVILENMEESAEYGEDLDDDGELDEDEDDDEE